MGIVPLTDRCSLQRDRSAAVSPSLSVACIWIRQYSIQMMRMAGRLRTRNKTYVGTDDPRPLANLFAHVAVAGHPVVADAFVVDPVDQARRWDSRIRLAADCRERPSGVETASPSSKAT